MTNWRLDAIFSPIYTNFNANIPRIQSMAPYFDTPYVDILPHVDASLAFEFHYMWNRAVYCIAPYVDTFQPSEYAT